MMPVNAKIGRKLESPSGKSTVDIATTDRRASNLAAQHDSRTSIHINNVIGSAALATPPVKEATEPAVLATPASGDNVIDMLPPPELKTSTFSTDDEVPDMELIHDNVELQRFRQRFQHGLTLTVDVVFLQRIIAVLINNHNITTTNEDLRQILEYYGDVELRTEKQKILTRAPKTSGFCGCSADETEAFVETVQKILVCGVNLTKYLPKFIEYLGGLGLSI